MAEDVKKKNEKENEKRGGSEVVEPKTAMSNKRIPRMVSWLVAGMVGLAGVCLVIPGVEVGSDGNTFGGWVEYGYGWPFRFLDRTTGGLEPQHRPPFTYPSAWRLTDDEFGYVSGFVLRNLLIDLLLVVLVPFCCVKFLLDYRRRSRDHFFQIRISDMLSLLLLLAVPLALWQISARQYRANTKMVQDIESRGHQVYMAGYGDPFWVRIVGSERLPNEFWRPTTFCLQPEADMRQLADELAQLNSITYFMVSDRVTISNDILEPISRLATVTTLDVADHENINDCAESLLRFKQLKVISSNFLSEELTTRLKARFPGLKIWSSTVEIADEIEDVDETE